jgi:hypothetical protein
MSSIYLKTLRQYKPLAVWRLKLPGVTERKQVLLLHTPLLKGKSCICSALRPG